MQTQQTEFQKSLERMERYGPILKWTLFILVAGAVIAAMGRGVFW